jgi:hypothetical protein
MHATADELLNKLELLTSDARRESATDVEQALICIEARAAKISELNDLLRTGVVIAPADMKRLEDIAEAGAEILKTIQETRDGLRENMGVAARQESFAKCVSGMLDLPGNSI